MAGWIFEKAPVLIETLIEVWRRGQFLGRKKRSQEQDNGTDTGRTDAAPAGERDEGHLTIVEQEKSRGQSPFTKPYETTVNNLKSVGKLAALPLDRITSEELGEFAAMRQANGMKVSTINRELATVRRMFNLPKNGARL